MTRQCSFAHISVFNAPKLLFYFVIDMPDIEEIKNMHQNIMELWSSIWLEENRK